MNRLLSILVTLFILFLVYLWIHHLLSTSAHSQAASDVITRTIAEEDDTEPEQPYEGIAVSDNEPSAAVQSDANNPEPEAQVQDRSTEPEPVKTEPKTETPAKQTPVTEAPAKPVPVPPAPKPVSKPADLPSGKHLVIAGNFLARANAEERVKQLKKLGYGQAEVVNFELSEYHTACAGRYSDINEARRIAKRIKENHNIDTYVRNGN